MLSGNQLVLTVFLFFTIYGGLTAADSPVEESQLPLLCKTGTTSSAECRELLAAADEIESPAYKRKNEFIRFGKRNDGNQGLSDVASEKRKNEFIRFGKRKNEFIRFGRGGLDDSQEKRKNEFIRFGKRKNEFIRFGKRKNEFIRFGKRKNEFIRFG